MMLKNDPKYLFLQASVELMDYLVNFMPINADIFQNYIMSFLDLGTTPDVHEEVIFYSVMHQSKALLREQIKYLTEAMDESLGLTIYSDVFSSIYLLVEMAKNGDEEVLYELSSRVLHAYELMEYQTHEMVGSVFELYLDGVENLIEGLLQEKEEKHDA